MMHSDLDKLGNLIFLDYRAKNKIKPFLHAKIIYFKKSLFRNFFVLKKRFEYILIFRSYLVRNKKNEYFKEYFLNGIPPLFRFSKATNKVFILFQNRNLFSYVNYFDRKLFFKFNSIIYFLIHYLLINSFLRNTDTIIVQTNSMRKTICRLKPKNTVIVQDNYWKNIKLERYNNLIKNNDEIKSKFLLKKIKDITRNNKIFFYPSSFEPHKNHKLLFNSFNKLSLTSNANIKLIVTVDKNQVPFKYRNNKLILFIGNQPIYTINQIYKIIDFLIFPSLNESLGLPLIEASFYNLPIIASNLDYVYEVCTPDFLFNPYSEKDIFQKILESTNQI